MTENVTDEVRYVCHLVCHLNSTPRGTQKLPKITQKVHRLWREATWGRKCFKLFRSRAADGLGSRRTDAWGLDGLTREGPTQPNANKIPSDAKKEPK